MAQRLIKESECDLTQRVTLGFTRSRTIVKSGILTSRKLFPCVTHFYLLNDLLIFFYFFLSESFTEKYSMICALWDFLGGLLYIG